MYEFYWRGLMLGKKKSLPFPTWLDKKLQDRKEATGLPIVVQVRIAVEQYFMRLESNKEEAEDVKRAGTTSHNITKRCETCGGTPDNPNKVGQS
jgi:hypothetical protein